MARPRTYTEEEMYRFAIEAERGMPLRTVGRDVAFRRGLTDPDEISRVSETMRRAYRDRVKRGETFDTNPRLEAQKARVREIAESIRQNREAAKADVVEAEKELEELGVARSDDDLGLTLDFLHQQLSKAQRLTEATGPSLVPYVVSSGLSENEVLEQLDNAHAESDRLDKQIEAVKKLIAARDYLEETTSMKSDGEKQES